MRNKLIRFIALMGTIFTITIIVVSYQWLMSLPQSTQTLFVGGVSGGLLAMIACTAVIAPTLLGVWLATQWHQRRQPRQYYPPQLRQRHQQPPIIMMPGQPMLPPIYPGYPGYPPQPNLFTNQNRREFEIIGKEQNLKESKTNE